MTPRKAFRALSSGWLAASLALLLVAAYISLGFGQNPYPHWIRFLSETSPGFAICAGLALNLLLAAARRFLDGLPGNPPGPDEIRRMDNSAAVALGETFSPSDVADWMRKQGFRAKVAGSRIVAQKGRFSFLPGAALRLGLAILVAAALASSKFREVSELVMHEGDTAWFFGSRVSLSGIRSDLPGTFFQVGDESAFRLKDVRVELSVDSRMRRAGPGFPKRLSGLHFRVTHFGYSPLVELENGRQKVSRRLDLDILPPGKSATVPIPELGIVLSVSLEPSKTTSKGFLKGKQFDLQSPLYRVILQNKGKAEPLSGTAGQGRPVQLGDVRVSIAGQQPRNGYFVKLQAIRDPAIPWAYAGITILLAGLFLTPSRLFWYRKSLCAALEGNTLYIGYNEEYYRKWAVYRFERWKRTLPSQALDRP